MWRTYALISALLLSFAASAEESHLFWRRKAILSQTEQLFHKKYYLIVGNSTAAEAIMPPEVCSLPGVSAGVYQASDAELDQIVSAIEYKPVLVIVVGSAKINPGQNPLTRIDEADHRHLSTEIAKAISSYFKC